MVDRVIASDAAFSKALYISGGSKDLDLLMADCRRGWHSLYPYEDDTVLTASVCGTSSPLCLGDPDMVVALVVAVGGRSSEALDMAAPDVGGSFPVSSSRWMRDLISSISSQTVEGAAVEFEDSVWWSPFCVSGFWTSIVLGASGEELKVRPELNAEAADCFREDMREGSAAVLSALDCLLRLFEVVDSAGGSWNVRVRGVIGETRELFFMSVVPFAKELRKVRARAGLSAAWPSPLDFDLEFSKSDMRREA